MNLNPRQTNGEIEQVCPKCGEACNHTPEEMQGFALDASQEAVEWLRRIEKGEI